MWKGCSWSEIQSWTSYIHLLVGNGMVNSVKKKKKKKKKNSSVLSASVHDHIFAFYLHNSLFSWSRQFFLKWVFLRLDSYGFIFGCASLFNTVMWTSVHTDPFFVSIAMVPLIRQFMVMWCQWFVNEVELKGSSGSVWTQIIPSGLGIIANSSGLWAWARPSDAMNPWSCQVLQVRLFVVSCQKIISCISCHGCAHFLCPVSAGGKLRKVSELVHRKRHSVVGVQEHVTGLHDNAFGSTGRRLNAVHSKVSVYRVAGKQRTELPRVCYPNMRSGVIWHSANGQETTQKRIRTSKETAWLTSKWIVKSSDLICFVLRKKGSKGPCIAKVRKSPVKRTKFVWEGGGFRKNRTSGFKWCFVYTLVWELKPEVRTFVRFFFFFWGEGFWSSETNFVRFAGLLRTFAMAPKAKKRRTQEEIEKGDFGPPTRKVSRKVFLWFLSDLNQATEN